MQLCFLYFEFLSRLLRSVYLLVYCYPSLQKPCSEPGCCGHIISWRQQSALEDHKCAYFLSVTGSLSNSVVATNLLRRHFVIIFLSVLWEVVLLVKMNLASQDEKRRTKETETDSRVMWKNKFEFAFNVLGYNVGLGNIWRFSYLCYKDGGGAFLVPYLLTAILAGIPLLFVEIALGQFTRHGCIAAWDLFPLMRGIGFASMAVSTYFNIYFIIAMGWCLLYLLSCFTSGPLPWSTCGNWWNSNSCVPVIIRNETNDEQFVNSSTQEFNFTQNFSGISSTTEFWNNYVLQRTSGIEDMGGFSNWKMLGCFIASWIMCYLCICKGIKTSGKAAYITVIAPYVLMLALFIRGMMLEGAGDGIRYYLTPNITRLKDPVVWLDGAGQVLFSLGICSGCLYGLGSYNKPKFDCYKSSYVFVATCCGTSLFFGFVVFSFIGHLALVSNKDIEDVFEGGPGLVFQVFPSELSLLQVPQLWSALFFACLVFLSIDAVFATAEGCITALADYWPGYFGTRRTKIWRAGFCFVAMLLGIPLLSDGGIYIFELFNMYAASGISILWIAFFEAIAIGWLYGIDKFSDDVKSMIGYHPPVIFRFTIKYVTPTLCMVVFTAYCVKYTPLTLGNYIYPWWADMIGWLLSLSVILSIPVAAVITLVQAPGTLREKWRTNVTSQHGKYYETEEETEKMTSFSSEKM